MDNIQSFRYTKEEISNMFKDDLKNHYMKRSNNEIVSVGTAIENREENIDLDKKENKKVNKLAYKIIKKTVGALASIACVLAYNYFPDAIKQNEICTWIKQEYNKNYSKAQVLENVEECGKKAYYKMEDVIPQNVAQNIIEKYVNNIKPAIVNFNFSKLLENKSIDNTVSVFNEDEVSFQTDELTLAQEDLSTSSEISLMDMDRQEIASKNISIKLPVNGTVTSIYGAREEVFKNVGYHTGVDIANVLNTPVASATDGVVVKAESMDKYYGNNIEIEKDGVIFKYAHLNKINVSEGQSINQGEIIGLMGSTGASTGSHLHFEIKIHNRTVDPELLIKIR